MQRRSEIRSISLCELVTVTCAVDSSAFCVLQTDKCIVQHFCTDGTRDIAPKACASMPRCSAGAKSALFPFASSSLLFARSTHQRFVFCKPTNASCNISVRMGQEILLQKHVLACHDAAQERNPLYFPLRARHCYLRGRLISVLCFANRQMHRATFLY